MTNPATRVALTASALIALLSMAAPATAAAFGAAGAEAAGAEAARAAETAPPDDLAAAHARRFEAMVGGELDALGELLADELTYAHSNGRVETPRSRAAPSGTSRSPRRARA